VLRARLIASLVERGVRRVDFPGEPYKWESQWTDTMRQRIVLSVYPATIRGRLLAFADRVRHRSHNRGAVHVDPRAGKHLVVTGVQA
jgi:CelD/BcsL family acetyltransferase involved in cellulose biosynthesis